MSSILNASASGGLVSAGDTSATLELQSDGTTKFTVSPTGAYGTILSGTAQASTSGTAIDFTGIPSWAKRITVMFNGVSTNGASVLLVQLGDSGGIENTGYLSTGSIVGASVASAAYTTGFGLSSSNAATYVFNGAVTISLIDGFSWVESATLSLSTGVTATSLSGGSKTLSAAIDRIRITTVNGTDTFDAGTVNIMFEG